jgi:hypothetical protein
MNDFPTGNVERVVAPCEPAVIRRLPERVDYTLVKTIFIDLPSGLPTLLWAARSDGNPLLRAFKDRTVRAIVRALRRAENSEGNRELVAGVRRELIQLCLQELHNSWSPHPDLSISETLVLPQRFRDGHRPPGPPVQHLRITVTRTVAPRRVDPSPPAAVVLERCFLPSGPAPWDPTIPFIDPEERDRIILELLHKHCPRLLGLRVSRRWRSNYSPEGWRLITQHIVPRLYDYLRPFYPVRTHRRAGRSGPGRYSAQLRRDITDIVRFEMGSLADKLTLERVTAAIQRHVARQNCRRRSTRRKRPKQ